MSFATTADHAGQTLPRRLLELLPGIGLLFIIGYGGKLIEQSISAYGKANHLALPNFEYVLWAIVIGLIIANTVGVPKIFRAGVAKGTQAEHTAIANAAGAIFALIARPR